MLVDTCPTCDGTGRETVPAPQFDDPYRTMMLRQECPRCDGTGRVDEETPPTRR